MSRGPDATTLLERRLRIAAEAAGATIAIVAADATPWASATFNGARHRLTLAGGGAAFERWIAALPEADLPLRGHLVADVQVVGRAVAGAVGLEVLTVEER
ncbi:hypothetical protein QLH51_10340 [Sphingomonas sp. 2R-10]|uniref:hypothetical protein n=1 Tax=Sphingomonas sp. 2R-10 TaxID=3045148 RepID=UPI000F787D52|nr:hypothetical protein [Sphingomonas sp. 2R-10]MDJ0277192.1 hypothetical protein [Sphingomonas sp. 2R-10]